MTNPEQLEARAFGARRHDLRLLPAACVVWFVAREGSVSSAVTALVGALVLVVVLVMKWLVHADRVRWPRNWGYKRRELAKRGALTVTIAACAGLAAATRMVPFDRSRAIPASPAPLFDADELRSAFAALSGQLPPPGNGLLAGLAVGDTSAVDAQLVADMKASSLSHLTAVSGANCLVAAGTLMAVAAALGAGVRMRMLVGLVALLGFCLVVGEQVTVLRAATMLGLVLAVRFTGRPTGGVPVLCSTVIALLLISPEIADDIGFALSVLATGGLVVLAHPLGNALSAIMATWLARAIAVPIAAQLACLPILIVLGSRVSGGAILANLLAAPAAAPATIVGVVGCLLATVAPGVSRALAYLAWPFTAWIAAVAHFFAVHSILVVPWPQGTNGAAAAALVGAAIAAAVVVRRRVRWVVAAMLTMATAISGAHMGRGIAVDAAVPSDWVIAACDVGQGDGFVVRSGADSLVIDTGPGDPPITECLSRLGIRRVSVLSLSHWDTDHAGGASDLIDTLPVESALVSTAPAGEQVLIDIRRRVEKIDVARAGDSGRAGDIEWRVLWPVTTDGWSDNDASLVLLVTVAGLRILALGDAGEAPQRRIAAELDGAVDVLKVAHHGSADHDPALYEKAGASVALIGVGERNSYGHPTSSTLSSLSRAGTAVLRTDTDGMIAISPSATGGVRAWCERGCHGVPVE